MSEEIDKRRIEIVMRQLYLVELEFSGNIGAPNFEDLYAYAMSRQRTRIRFFNQACRLLKALEVEEQSTKSDLTGEDLWKSIEDASKP